MQFTPFTANCISSGQKYLNWRFSTFWNLPFLQEVQPIESEFALRTAVGGRRYLPPPSVSDGSLYYPDLWQACLLVGKPYAESLA